MTKDEEQLNLLATFHYVMGGIGALFACMPLLHVGLGVAMLVKPELMSDKSMGAPAPPFFAYLFIVMGAILVLIGWASVICTVISGRYLKRRQKRMFSFVIAALMCAFVPFGTVLGVFTIIVLSRDSVLRLYAGAPAIPPPPLSPAPPTQV